MRLRRVATSDATSTEWIEYTSTLPYIESLLKQIGSNPIVDEIYQPTRMDGNTTPYTILAITLRPGVSYSDAEPTLVELITNWYEEYCGEIEIYRTLQFTLDVEGAPEVILRPSPNRPWSQYGHYKVMRAIAETIGEGHTTRVYDYLLIDLANQLGIPRPDIPE